MISPHSTAVPLLEHNRIIRETAALIPDRTTFNPGVIISFRIAETARPREAAADKERIVRLFLSSAYIAESLYICKPCRCIDYVAVRTCAVPLMV